MTLSAYLDRNTERDLVELPSCLYFNPRRSLRDDIGHLVHRSLCQPESIERVTPVTLPRPPPFAVTIYHDCVERDMSPAGDAEELTYHQMVDSWTGCDLPSSRHQYPIRLPHANGWVSAPYGASAIADAFDAYTGLPYHTTDDVDSAVESWRALLGRRHPIPMLRFHASLASDRVTVVSQFLDPVERVTTIDLSLCRYWLSLAP